MEERKLARANQPIMRLVIDDVLDVSDTFETAIGSGRHERQQELLKR
jgi:hypothetical protein